MMDNPGILTVAAFAISILSVLLSWWVSRRQTQLSSGQTRVQARLLDLEEAREHDRLASGARAQVTVEMVRTRDTGRLYVLNDGPASARNVRVTLDGQPLHEHQLIHEGVGSIGTIGPGARVEFIVTTWDSVQARFHAEATWDNPSGQSESWHPISVL
jgi:hypothetical protein